MVERFCQKGRSSLQKKMLYIRERDLFKPEQACVCVCVRVCVECASAPPPHMWNWIVLSPTPHLIRFSAKLTPTFSHKYAPIKPLTNVEYVIVFSTSVLWFQFNMHKMELSQACSHIYIVLQNVTCGERALQKSRGATSLLKYFIIHVIIGAKTSSLW